MKAELAQFDFWVEGLCCVVDMDNVSKVFGPVQLKLKLL